MKKKILLLSISFSLLSSLTLSCTSATGTSTGTLTGTAQLEGQTAKILILNVECLIFNYEN